MSIERITYYIVECDGYEAANCRQQLDTRGSTKRKVKREAKAYGWSFAEGDVLCPPCRAVVLAQRAERKQQ